MWQGCMIMHIPAGPFVPASVVLMVMSSWLWLCMRARPYSLAHPQQLQVSRSTMCLMQQVRCCLLQSLQ